MPRIQANLLLLISGAIWGAGFVAQSTAMDAISPLWFITLRFAIATLVAMPLAIIETKRATEPLRLTTVRNFVFIGLALLPERRHSNSVSSIPASPIPVSSLVFTSSSFRC